MRDPKWESVIKSTACDECDAKEGDRCRSKSGRPTTIPHLNRRVKARN